MIEMIPRIKLLKDNYSVIVKKLSVFNNIATVLLPDSSAAMNVIARIVSINPPIKQKLIKPEMLF
jgi:hypothetical protein